MHRHEIEQLPEVIEATSVLMSLEGKGLVEPAIASGWTRARLTDSTSNDIDVSYVGSIHYEEAQQLLRESLDELCYDPAPWDIDGIWNAQLAYGVEHTVENFLIYYVDSIDSVYLATDGRLHDPTGFGFQDAEARLLRINDYDRKHGLQQIAREEVNICLEGCRRISQLRWTPTDESTERIIEGIANWEMLTDDEKAYFYRKLASKFKEDERQDAQTSYATYGWGFIFNEL